MLFTSPAGIEDFSGRLFFCLPDIGGSLVVRAIDDWGRSMFSRLKGNRDFWILLFCDCVLVCGSYYMAFLIRFDAQIPDSQLRLFYSTIWWILPLKLIFFAAFDMYKGMWRYFGVHDVINIVKAGACASALVIIIILTFFRFEGFSRSIFVIDFTLCLAAISGLRLLIRIFYAPLSSGRVLGKTNSPVQRFLIIGAGSAGEKLLREIKENPNLSYDVVGFIDDLPSKYRQTLHGVPVLGPLGDLSQIAKDHKVSQIIIAVPSAGAAQMRTIVEGCKKTGIAYKTLPGLGDLIDGRITVARIRDVHYEDLLGRKPVLPETAAIGAYLSRKTVLVTGGAGSIGSELCRQIARYKPARLIIVEQNESGLSDIEIELKTDFPELETVPVLGPIQNKVRMGNVFRQFFPEVVFHAAAYKHVPMLELNPCEAVFNNILGSKVIMELCHRHNIDRCVVVSTDKAVRPTNVMGVSKRVTELLAQSYARENGVKFMAVRFGNVIGSAGSVLPLFKRQIARGGPLTVTHPDATRYFMTIAEAASLILQAGAFGKGGELFILKMGTPIRIANMARDIITLSGLQPDVDIKIRYVGLRPGEKLFEELITKDEGIQPTEHKDIMVLKTDQCPSIIKMEKHIQDLIRLAHHRDPAKIKAKLCEIVPEYRPEIYKMAGNHDEAKSNLALSGSTIEQKSSISLADAPPRQCTV
jgi:FlaA1/EpsC-like NDP-sugar epimerase